MFHALIIRVVAVLAMSAAAQIVRAVLWARFI